MPDIGFVATQGPPGWVPPDLRWLSLWIARHSTQHRPGELWLCRSQSHQHPLLQPAGHPTAVPSLSTVHQHCPHIPSPAFEAASKLYYLVTSYLISREYMLTATTLLSARNLLSASDEPSANWWKHFSAAFPSWDINIFNTSILYRDTQPLRRLVIMTFNDTAVPSH